MVTCLIVGIILFIFAIGVHCFKVSSELFCRKKEKKINNLLSFALNLGKSKTSTQRDFPSECVFWIIQVSASIKSVYASTINSIICRVSAINVNHRREVIKTRFQFPSCITLNGNSLTSQRSYPLIKLQNVHFLKTTWTSFFFFCRNMITEMWGNLSYRELGIK